MNLNQTDCERFYRIWFQLLRHVNLQEKLIPPIPEDPKPGSLSSQDAKKLRTVLRSSDKWLASFLEEQRDRLSEQDLALVDSWKWRLSGDFYIFRRLKSYSVFLNHSTGQKFNIKINQLRRETSLCSIGQLHETSHQSCL